MNILQIGITVFCFIETLNVIILYFNPTFKYGNGVGVFDDYKEAIQDDPKKDFINYMVNWVAGTKLIFIMVGMVVVIWGNYDAQFYTVIALIISILSFYWKLFPTIKKLDLEGKITPKGYSKTLNFMILSFVTGFLVILIIEIVGMISSAV